MYILQLNCRRLSCLLDTVLLYKVMLENFPIRLY